jgi:hypothetical protein
VNRLIAAALAIAALPACAAPPQWPAGAEQRIEWRITALPAAGAVRVGDYDRYSRLVGDPALVCDDRGTATASAVRDAAEGGRELWFEAVPGRRYFSYWGKSLKPPQPGRGAEAAEPAEIATAEATAGELVRRPSWRVRDSVVEQTSKGRNVTLVSVPEFEDFELSFRVKPTGGAGVMVRGQAADPDVSGVYWLAEGKGSSFWGVVRGSVPGQALVRGEWNDVRVTARGRTVEFVLNGTPVKSLELPPEKAARGPIVLATYGGPAEFDDVRVVVAGRETFADDFSADLDPGRWRDVEGLACRGFVRVVNTGTTPATYKMTLKFHVSPWSHNGTPFEKHTPPGRATPWLLPSAVAPRAPFTVRVGGGEAGRVEYVATLADREPLQSLDLPGCVEFQRPDAARPEDLPSDEELGRATLAAVREMTFKGRPPRRFPTGYPQGNAFDMEAGRVLGFTMAFGMPDPEIFRRLGYRSIYAYTHLLTASGKGAGYKPDVNRQEMEKLAERYRSRGLLENVSTVSVFDEPAFGMKAAVTQGLPDMAKDPEAWSQIVARAGLEPGDLVPADDPAPAGAGPLAPELWQQARGWKLADRESNPLGVYRTMRVFQAIYPTRFANARSAIRAAFGDGVLVTANVHANHWFRDTLTDIEPWGIYSEQEALDVPQACDYFVGWPQNEEFLIDSMRCAVRPHDKPVNAFLASQASYMTRSSASLKLRAFAALGAGARSLAFYEWGPRRFATENWYDTDRGKLRAIGEINHAAGWAEDVLLDGRPPVPPVAILFSRSGDLWDSLDVGALYTKERGKLFHLLRGLHRQVDFLNDDFLPADAELDRYRLIFLSQRCISRAHAERLLAWAERGGTLVAVHACGQLDELARPSGFLPGAFGIAKLTAVEGGRQVAGVATSAHVSDIEIDGAEVAATFTEGGPAIVTRSRGSGRLVYCGFMLGGAYHSGEVRMEKDVLLGMQAAVRDLVSSWLPGEPECATDDPLVGARLIEAASGRAVVLVNSTGRPEVERVRVTVRARGVDRVESLEQGPLRFEQGPGTITCDMPLGLTDIVLLTGPAAAGTPP